MRERAPGGAARWVARLVACVGMVGGVGVLGGCDDLERFSNGSGDAYCGAITLGSSFRTGLSPRVQMRLKIDASLLDGPGSPGVISTFEAEGDGAPERRLLQEAVLRPIPPMAHDSLSRLSFGEGRERNAVYAVSPVDPEAESLLAVLSLLADGTAEVRLLRAGSPPSADGTPAEEGRRPLFGIFSLSRQEGQCGF